MPGYAGLVEEILSRGRLEPVEGRRTDTAHPAIYPTGHLGRLRTDEKMLFDLVVRRFLSCFGGEEVVEVVRVELGVGSHRFVAEERKVLAGGWTRFSLDRPRGDAPSVVSSLSEGDHVALEGILVEERVTRRPAGYEESTLLGRMERERIGTKATRADTVSTLVERGYLESRSLVPTELGFSLVEAMDEYCPQILSTELTREVEAHLEAMESSDGSSGEFFEEALTELLSQVFEVKRHEARLAELVRRPSERRDGLGRVVLGPCPSCKEGRLWVVRSRSSGKRFVGCSNFASGCRASSPLPQRGTLSPLPKPCGGCGWPVVRLGFGRNGWRLCVNDRCPRKVNVYSMKRSRPRSSE